MDLNIPAGAKVLELGCGPGNLSHWLALMDCQVVGADRSHRMIRHAEKTDSRAEFVQADATELPFADGEFDFVLLASLINVVPDRAKLLQEVKRVVKPDGVASALFPMPEFDRNAADRISAARMLNPISAAAISAWAAASKKLDRVDNCREFSSAGFASVSTNLYLEGNIGSVTAT
jgi:ubiquinone/menaquinone biosynthesis C-methylase UbiE